MTDQATSSTRSLTLELPGLVAGRDLADQLLDKLASDYQGTTVTVDARRTSSGSASFASQTVQRVLTEGEAAALLVIGAPERFAGHFRDAAARQGVAARLRIDDNPRRPEAPSAVRPHLTR